MSQPLQLKYWTNLHPALMVRLRDEFGLRQFVETGTGDFQTTTFAALAFANVSTVEIDAERQARNRMACRFDNVTLYDGPSQDVLGCICHFDMPRTLFWLDAHWSGIGEKLSPECPVIGELAVIGQLSDANHHVVAIDDCRLFSNPPPPPHNAKDWPVIFEVLDAITWTTHKRQVGDVLLATPWTFDWEL